MLFVFTSTTGAASSSMFSDKAGERFPDTPCSGNSLLNGALLIHAFNKCLSLKAILYIYGRDYQLCPLLLPELGIFFRLETMFVGCGSSKFSLVVSKPTGLSFIRSIRTSRGDEDWILHPFCSRHFCHLRLYLT